MWDEANSINNTIVGKTKLQSFKSAYLADFCMLGAESWTVFDEHTSRKISAELKFLR